MLFDMTNRTILLAMMSLLLILGSAWAQNEVTDLEFGDSPLSDVDAFRTLQSIVKVADGLYLMTHYGEREGLFRRENQELIDNPFIDDRTRYCSVFSAAAGKSVIVGRNWDNETVGSIVVSLFRPPSGYSSISFSRAIDLGFGKSIDLEEISSLEIGKRLLLAPFYAMDGMNEHGITVAVTANDEIVVEPVGAKESVFLTFLIRKILDHTKNIEEAVSLADECIPFDYNVNSFNSHLFVADSSGRSVVLEYAEGQWRKTYGDESWQVMSTKPIYNVPDADLREKCGRYRSMSETLENADGNVDWKGGMNILQNVAQKGTTWSIVYSPATGELHFSAYQDWETVYRLSLRSR